MTHHQFHWIEKLQVQLTIVGTALAAYFLVWPMVCPADPGGAVAFVAAGSLGKAAVLAAALCVLSALCCVTTVSARPAGTMAAAMIGLGGLSLHSGAMREMLWARQADLAAMYWQMVLEVLLLAAIVLVAAQVARGVRKLLGAAAGGWAWRDPLDSLGEHQQRKYLQAMASEEGVSTNGLLGGGFARLVVENLGRITARQTGRRMPDRDVLTRWVLCFLVCLAIAVLVLLLLARSRDRGQVLFALVAGNFLATLVAYQVFPTRLSLPAWLTPMTVAVGFYVLAAAGALRTGQGAWMYVEACYLALPIDWMTAGLGGALLGYWASARMHEAKFLERQDVQQPEGV